MPAIPCCETKGLQPRAPHGGAEPAVLGSISAKLLAIPAEPGDRTLDIANSITAGVADIRVGGYSAVSDQSYILEP